MDTSRSPLSVRGRQWFRTLDLKRSAIASQGPHASLCAQQLGSRRLVDVALPNENRLTILSRRLTNRGVSAALGHWGPATTELDVAIGCSNNDDLSVAALAEEARARFEFHRFSSSKDGYLCVGRFT
jgi:hypothetical protein